VPVPAAECGRAAAGRAIKLGRRRPAAPAVLVETSAEDPGLLRQRGRVLGDPRERCVDRRLVAKVDLTHLDRPPGEVDVSVVPAGRHEPTAKVDPFCATVLPREVRGPSGRHDPAIAGDERLRARAVADMDPSAVEQRGAHGWMMPAVSAMCL
jgi:hypothetical protein